MEIFWTKLLKTHLRFHEIIIVYGNIHDHFPNHDGNFVNLTTLIENIVVNIGYKNIGYFNELGNHWFQSNNKTDKKHGEKANPLKNKEGQRQENEVTYLTAGSFEKITFPEGGSPTCWILENMSAAFPEIENWNDKSWRRHEELLDKIRESNNRHRFIVIFPEEGHIPTNFLVNVPGVKRLLIPKPNFSERAIWIRRIEEKYPHTFTDKNKDEEKNAELLDRLIATTDGLSWRDLGILGKTSKIAKEDVLTLVRRFKFGEATDYWKALDRKKLFDAKTDFTRGRDALLGQNEAVEKAINIVAKAYFNLGAITTPIYNRPRGVFFLVGPTGVGKTMLAKKLAKLIFGDEESCLVFDMSEYTTSHSEARLIGSPPGYVGHDQGGQLTGALRQNPFNVIVFDEIDKADHTILTKFLQILDEGRLTDGKGQTCYFSETLIIFTSNTGAKKLLSENSSVQADSDYRDLQKYYQDAIREMPGLIEHPEILNRIGLSNIIPFRHILDVEYVKKVIFDLLDSAETHFAEEYGVILTIEDEEALVEYIVGHTNWKEFGMRNVKQVFEAKLSEKIAYAQLQNVKNLALKISVSNNSLQIIFNE